MKKTLVLGATNNSSRYAYLAALRLKQHGYEIALVGNKEGEIDGTEIQTGTPVETGIHTITLYLNPERQKPYYPYIFSLNPIRIIFNPGTENSELKAMAVERGIEVVEGCTLVMLSTHQY